ncbi:MAG TPA: ATP-binding cassette domain-containing protein [Gemmatimonadales bacterium]|nr:ATP-binding cassette domain-containing protein [Gemmatimonadales bacterium]
MIAMQGVRKRFGARVVLDGLDVTLHRGRVTVLVGPNGAGKTTLLKLVLGLARPDAGTIAVGDHLLDGTPDYRAAIGYMPQIARFPAHQTGRELLAMLAALRAEATAPDLTLADAFGLGEQFDRPLGVLSGGTRQKVNAVLAFAFRPTLVILDEPTAGLDPLASAVLKDRLAVERARGTTVLVTSHVLAEVEELADDILFLSEGRATWQGGATELKRRTGTATLERAVARLLGGGAALAVA